MKAKQFVDKIEIKEKPTKENPVIKKTWDEFRATGLFLIVNQLMHVFGWCLILQVDENNSVTNVFPSRSIYRGFSEQAQDEDYKKVTEYLNNNSSDLLTEVTA